MPLAWGEFLFVVSFVVSFGSRLGLVWVSFRSRLGLVFS